MIFFNFWRALMYLPQSSPWPPVANLPPAGWMSMEKIGWSSWENQSSTVNGHPEALRETQPEQPSLVLGASWLLLKLGVLLTSSNVQPAGLRTVANSLFVGPAANISGSREIWNMKFWARGDCYIYMLYCKTESGKLGLLRSLTTFGQQLFHNISSCLSIRYRLREVALW